MKQIILGTAGHIDHGKTSLIKALTGTNTDRLKEEKLRGITIELGFTSFTLPCGQNLGVVDVPGHEKFIKNMVAGATGIDILAMVIAADEGVMPQTREHMEICSLLKIKYGIVILTKIDTVDEEWKELIKDDIIQFTKNTFLETAPIIPVSSLTGLGLDNLINKLSSMCRKVPKRNSSELFILPVDRVFTMKGFGTVVTGTLTSGQIKLGDSIMIYPNCTHAKVRGVQVHNKAVKIANPGTRTAINFQGLGKNEITRGNIIANKNTLTPSYMADVAITFLKSNRKPLKNRAKVRFHTNTSEIMGNIILMDRDELYPGENCLSQIHLESSLTMIKGDRFVIRSYSPIRTIGGGEILNPIPKKRKRFYQKSLTELKLLSNGNLDEIIEYHIKTAKTYGISLEKLIIGTRVSKKILNSKILTKLNSKNIIRLDKDNPLYFHETTFLTLIAQTTKILKAYHTKYPIKLGMPKEELKSKFQHNISSKLFNATINTMIKENTILLDKDIIRLYTHTIELKHDQEKIKNKIIELYKKEKLTPPYYRNLAKIIDVKTEKIKPILDLLIKEKTLVKVKEELYFSQEIIDTVKHDLINYLKKNGEITTPEFKNMIGTSRKYVIPLIEYFDSIRLTIRIEDRRRLRVLP